MFRIAFMPGAFALVLSLPINAVAADADIDAIRREIRELRQSYEARIEALERRLKDAETRAPVAAAPGPAVVPSAPASAGGLAAFNPAISVVLQGRYANLSRSPSEFAISGFAPEGEIGPGRRGFSLAESEITLFANVDDRFAGNLTFALSPENEVSVEEAYGRWIGAPYGLAPKFGRFLSGVGYLNEQHQHVWDFIDAPLAYQAFFGGQYATDGLQVKWVAPIDTFLELGGEAGNGDGFPGGPRDKNGNGAGALFAHAGGDVGVSHSWRAGVSYLRTRAEEHASQRLGIADFVWKYAPGGNARETNFKIQGEYFRASGGEPGTQSGWYLQSVYQFMPRWRVGARYDRLDPGAASDFRPRRASVMLDYSPSEFSRLRLQLAQSKTLPDLTDNQLFVQYILTLGAHAAHRY